MSNFSPFIPHIFHTGKHRFRIFIREIIQEFLNWTRASTSLIVTPAPFME